jgi:hypothetical protein
MISNGHLPKSDCHCQVMLTFGLPFAIANFALREGFMICPEPNFVAVFSVEMESDLDSVVGSAVPTS